MTALRLCRLGDGLVRGLPERCRRATGGLPRLPERHRMLEGHRRAGRELQAGCRKAAGAPPKGRRRLPEGSREAASEPASCPPARPATTHPGTHPHTHCPTTHLPTHCHHHTPRHPPHTQATARPLPPPRSTPGHPIRTQAPIHLQRVRFTNLVPVNTVFSAVFCGFYQGGGSAWRQGGRPRGQASPVVIT